MLEAPRLLLPRALDPLYPREPPPKASRFPPPLRERSRPPIRSAPPPLALFPKPAPPPRLPMPAPPPRLLERLPPCRPNCCRALACRLLRESPRVVPPNLSAVARSRYGAPPRCSGLCCHLLPPPAPPTPPPPRAPPPPPTPPTPATPPPPPTPADVAAIAAAGDWIRWPVPAKVVTIAATNIRVAIEIVVSVDSDVVVAAPSTAPTPTAAPERPHHHTHAERNRHTRGIVARRRIIDRRVRIVCRTVHHDGIIRRHIDHLRIRLFDDDHALVFDDFRFYFLLLGRFQIALILGLLAHSLNGIHHIALLREEGVAKIGRPLDVVCQTLYHIG